MLFNSYEFIFLFMPAAVAGFALLSSTRHKAALFWLTVASLFFYAYWDWHSLWILVASTLFNFACSLAIGRSADPVSKRWLVFGIAGNLVALGIFKYAGFAVQATNDIAGTHFAVPDITLPLGISFFTFTQIAYLVDVYLRETSDHDPVRYTLFVSYFPHLIAGPILHHKPMMGQLADPAVARLEADNWILGLIYFSIGLAKKLLLADPLGAIASPMFQTAQYGGELSAGAAWIATSTYTLQLYFDFSGYSDMAVGLSLLFGVRIPVNFLSPLKATSIVELWRRWHISLMNFLRDYVYMPLSMMLARHAARRRLGKWPMFLLAVVIPVNVTFLVSGIWHGAGWTFIVFGIFTGLAMTVESAWRRAAMPRLPLLAAWFLTMLVFLISIVFFRSADLATAQRILTAMASVSFPGAGSWTGDPNLALINFRHLVMLSAVAAAIGLLAPNSVQIVETIQRHLANREVLSVRLVSVAMAGFGLLFAISVLNLGKASAFLYFRF